MKDRITLVAAVLAIAMVAFVRCEPSRALEEIDAQDQDRPLLLGDPDQLVVTPREDQADQDPEKEKDPGDKKSEAMVTVPYEQLPVPVGPDRENVRHAITFGVIDNPEADSDMVIKPPGNRTWPMPVLPRVK